SGDIGPVVPTVLAEREYQNAASAPTPCRAASTADRTASAGWVVSDRVWRRSSSRRRVSRSWEGAAVLIMTLTMDDPRPCRAGGRDPGVGLTPIIPARIPAPSKWEEFHPPSRRARLKRPPRGSARRHPSEPEA